MAYHMMLFFSADHYSNQPNSKIYIHIFSFRQGKICEKRVHLLKKITVLWVISLKLNFLGEEGGF